MKKLIIILVILNNVAFGQSVKENLQEFLYQKQYQEALKDYDKMAYSQAYPILSELAEKEYQYESCAQMLAYSYKQTRQYKLSADWYAKVVNFSEVDDDVFFNYAQVLRILKDYEGAEKQITTYKARTGSKSSVVNVENYQQAVASVKRKTTPCDFANYEAINSKFADFSAVANGADIVFLSGRHE